MQLNTDSGVQSQPARVQNGVPENKKMYAKTETRKGIFKLIEEDFCFFICRTEGYPRHWRIINAKNDIMMSLIVSI